MNRERNREQIHSPESLAPSHPLASSSLGAVQQEHGKWQEGFRECSASEPPHATERKLLDPSWCSAPGAAWLPTQPALQLQYLPFPGIFWHVPVELLQGKGFSVGNEGTGTRGAAVQRQTSVSQLQPRPGTP